MLYAMFNEIEYIVILIYCSQPSVIISFNPLGVYFLLPCPIMGLLEVVSVANL